MKPLYLFKSHIVAEFIGCITRLSHKECLPPLNDIALDNHSYPDKNIVSDLPEDMFEIEESALREICERITTDIPLVEDLNVCQNERERGIGINYNGRGRFSFRSRYGGPEAMNHFIDLGALSREVYRAILKEYHGEIRVDLPEEINASNERQLPL